MSQEDKELLRRLEKMQHGGAMHETVARDTAGKAATCIRALASENERLEALAYTRDPFDLSKRGLSFKDLEKATREQAVEDALAANKRERALKAENERLRKALDSLAYPDGHLRGPITDGPELRELDEAYQALRNGA